MSATSVNQRVDLHKCNEDDYDMFYPPARHHDEIEFYKENKSFYCMNDFDTNGEPTNLNLYNSEWSNGRYISVRFDPCYPEI